MILYKKTNSFQQNQLEFPWLIKITILLKEKIQMHGLLMEENIHLT